VKEQISKMSQNTANLKAMRQMVEEAQSQLTGPADRFSDFGKLLHEQWMIKRGLSSKITTSVIDGMYEAGMKAGALGGKLLGAGGGGFLMLFVPPERQSSVQTALGKLLHVPTRFDFTGSQIVYFAHEVQH
jgi:D-glycero-alpha-D-manno-heptose-7-phosphate kinase